MEFGKWKNLICEWIRSTNFISIESDNVEHTDIDSFYEEFRLKLTENILKENSVTEFLQAHYDSFEFHLDDSKEISSLDYVYIYSLLLHFSCVKYPDQYFHKLCQSLDDTSQMCIAKFFNLLLVNEKFDRDTIRAAITAARPTSLQLLSVDSPIKTPKHMLSPSPTTPRTTQLEDKRRELIMLKAQIDSERYERSMLEMVLKQTEQKMEKMGQNQRKYIEEIQSLKNELLSLDTENRSPNKYFISDQKNHRLQKDLLDKEERIIQLQLTIENLMDDKKAAGEKLALNEKQISHWISKSRDLEQTILDVGSELDHQSDNIKSLQETNTELKTHILEMRGGMPGIDSLNASYEGLDFSFARITNSSDISTSSPENLGRAVIDVQFKEKQIENDMLRDKLELLKHDFNRIATEIRNFCNSNSDLESLTPKEPHEEYSLPLKQFEKCKTYFVEKLAISEEFVKNLSTENNSLKERINELGDAQEELRATLSKVKHEFTVKERMFDAKICELDELILTKNSENTNLFSQIEKQQIDIESLSSQLDAINKLNGRLENELATSSATITELKGLCESRYAEIESIGCQNDLVRAENNDLSSAVAQLESTVNEINHANATENDRLTSEIVELSRIVASITDENAAAEEKIQQLTQKVFQSGEETRELRDLIGEISQREDRLIEDHQKLMEKMSEVLAENVVLTQEVTELAQSRSEINERFEKSISDRETLKTQLEAHVTELTNALAQAENEKTTLALEFEQTSANNLQLVNHLKLKINELTANLESLNKTSLELTDDLNKSSAEKLALAEQLGRLEDINAQSEIRITQILTEKSELTEQMSAMNFDLSQMGMEVVNVKLQLKALGQTNESTVKSNSDLVETISKLQAEKRNLSVRVDTAEAEIASLLSRIADLGGVINDTSNKNLELASEKTELIENVAKFEAQIQILNQTNETVANMNTEYIETISKCQNDIRVLGDQLKQANSEKDSSLARIQELGQIMTNLSSQNLELANEKSKVTGELIKYQTNFTNSETRIAELEHEIQCLSRANETANKSNSENVASISNLHKECAAQKAQLEQANLQIANSVTRIEQLCQLVKENSETQTQMDEEITRLNIINERAIEEKSELAKKLESEIQNVKQISTLAAKSNSEYTENITKLQGQISTMTNQLDKANDEIGSSLAQINELGRIVDENSVEMSNFKKANDFITKENHELTEGLIKFEADYTYSESRIAELQLEVQSMTQINDTMANTISDYCENVSKLQEEIRNLSVEIDQANEKLANSGVRIQELNQIVDQTTMENSGLTKEKAALNEQLAKYQDDCINSESRISELVTEIEALNQMKDAGNKSNSEYIQVIAKLQEENRNFEGHLQNAKTEITNSEAQIKELREVYDEASNEISNLKATNNLVSIEKMDLNQHISKFQIDCANLELELQTLNQRNESAVKLNTEYSETISKLQEEIKILSGQLSQANTEIDSSATHVEELNKIVDENSTKIVGLSSEKAQLTEQLNKFQTDCVSSEARILELTAEIQALNQIKESVDKSNLEYIEVISKLQDENGKLDIQLQKAANETVRSEAQIKDLKEVVDKTSLEIADLKIANDSVTKEKADLTEQINTLQIRSTNLELQLQALGQSNEEAIKLSNEYSETILKLQEETQNLNVQLVQANGEIGRSEVRVQELNKIFDENSTKIIELVSEKTELAEQIANLQTVCSNSEIRISSLATEILALDQIKESATKSNSVYVENISKLEEDIRNLNNQLHEATTENVTSIALIKQLREVVDNSSAEISNLKTNFDLVTKEKDDLVEQISKFQSECARLERELQTLNQLNVAAAKTSSEYSETISKLQEESQTLHVQLVQANAEIDSSAVRIQELIEKFDQVEANCAKSETRVLELTKENQSLIQTNDTTVKANSEYIHTISNLQEDNKNLKFELDKSNDELSNSIARIQEVSAEKSELTEKLGKLQTDLVVYETRITELTTEISEITIKRDEIITKLEVQISDVLVRKDELEQTLRNSTLEVQALNQSNNSVAKSNSDFSEKITKLEKSSEILTSELKSVKETNTRLVEETESQVKKLAEYESLISELQREKDELLQTVANLKDENAELTVRLENTAIQIEEKSNINFELQSKVEHLAKEKSKIEAHLTQEEDKFAGEISKIIAENTKLSEEVTTLQVEVKRMIQSNESQAKELSTKNSELSSEIIELRANLEKSHETNLRLTEEIFTSESKVKELSAENKIIGDKITAVNSDHRVEKDRMLKKVEQLTHEIDNLVQNYESIQNEKTDLDVDLKIARSELSSLKESNSDAHSIRLALIEKEKAIISLEYNLNKQQKDNLEKDKYIENLDQRISHKEMEIANLLLKLQESNEKDKLLNREKSLNEKFTQDIAILKAKLCKHREVSEAREKQWNIEKEELMAAIEEQKTAEERITENRLELVGKLEKMKTKMKTLYNEEMVKVKTKHENEISDLQKQAKEKFVKYDSHIEKLSTQIYQLNERNLGLEKDNKFLRTKIDFLEINTDAAGSTLALNSMGSGGSRNLLQSTNLKMEDEEGEVFNNTYLTDLKSGGRISPTSGGLGRDSVRYTELQHRNSLMPRHLRSTYAAQYGDQDLREEDLKDPINFDDSLSSLLYGGQRKKISGATTYKRPGPPTPSKNAGRLSFGAVTELQSREVLKENNSNIPTRLSMTGNGFGGNKRNTPGKLKSFFSNSTSKIKDDLYTNTMVATNKSQIQQLLITSTPRRRSTVNRSRPRLSGHLSIRKTQKFSARQIKIGAHIQSAGSIAQFPVDNVHGDWRQPGSILDSESCTSTSQTESDYEPEPCHEQNSTLKSSLNTNRRRSTNKAGGGGYTVKTSLLSNSRTRYRIKSKENRLENFNRARRSINNFILRKSLLNRSSIVMDADHHHHRTDLESDPYGLLKDLVELSSQAVAAAKFNDGQPPSFAEFEKLTKFKISESPFDVTTTPITNNNSETVIKSSSSSRNKKSLYSGGVIINRKIPRLSIRIGGYHILNRGDSNDSSIRSFDQSSCIARNWSHACILWRHYEHRMKIFVGIGIVGLLLILNIFCAVKFLYF